MQLLVIRLDPSGENPEFALVGKKQIQDSFTPGDWKRVKSHCRGRRVLLLIPDSDVVLTSINLPSKNKKQLLQAVPYALEDAVAEDIEDLHFAVYQGDSSNNAHVAIINRIQLGNYIDLIRSNGIPLHYVLPEVLSQNWKKGSWSIISDDRDTNANQAKNILVRTNQFSGFTCDDGLMDILLSEQFAKDEPESILSNIEQNQLPELLHKTALEKIDKGIITLESATSALNLNLLTSFVRDKRASSINLKAWRPVAMIASLLAAVWIGIFAWQNNILSQTSRQLDQQISSIFKSVFPDSRIVNPAVQMKSELEKLRNSSQQVIDSPLPLLADVSPLLKEFQNLSLREIRYQESELSLIMQSPNLASLEKFKRDAAQKRKLNIEIKTSTTTADKVEATLIVSPQDRISDGGNLADVGDKS